MSDGSDGDDDAYRPSAAAEHCAVCDGAFDVLEHHDPLVEHTKSRPKLISDGVGA